MTHCSYCDYTPCRCNEIGERIRNSDSITHTLYINKDEVERWGWEIPPDMRVPYIVEIEHIEGEPSGIPMNELWELLRQLDEKTDGEYKLGMDETGTGRDVSEGTTTT